MVRITLSKASTNEETEGSLPAVFCLKEDPALVVIFFSEFAGMVVTPAEKCPRFRGYAAGKLNLDRWGSCFSSSWKRLPKGSKVVFEQD